MEAEISALLAELESDSDEVNYCKCIVASCINM